MKLLLALTLGGSVLALFLLVLRYIVLKRMPSTVYYYAWLLVLLRFALPLPGLFPTSIGTDVSEPVSYWEAAVPERTEQIPAPALPNTVPDGLPAAPSASDFPSQSSELPTNAEDAVPHKANPVMSRHLSTLIFSVWALGTLLSLGLTVAAYMRFTSRLRYSLRSPDRYTCELYASIPGRKPELFRSDELRTPLMFGIFSPKIILPEREYDEELMLNILRHELMHYRRFDTLYKWISVTILSVHWFNPLSWFIRKELNRACELSCDEMLLRSMTREEKQSYGNTLVSMAASSALPAGVIATTFATEKRNLKERLVQIMTYKKSGARMFAAVLALVLLAGCGMAAGPQTPKEETSEPAAIVSGDVVRVSTVDEFLAAIAPNTAIELAAGIYDLSTAANYGNESDNPNYSWDKVWSAEKNQVEAELIISGVEGLSIRGEGMDKTVIAAVPRYANVIRFRNCIGLSVSELTAGHTTAPGFCAGGVLRLESCTDAGIENCGLYGCGTVGIDAIDTSGLSVTGCRIYECSSNAVSLQQCRGARVEGCEVYRHGVREGQGSTMALFTASYSDNVVIYKNRVYDNASQFLLQLNYTKNAAFISNDVHDNRFDAGVFQFEQYGATVDGCAFTNNGSRNWVQSSGIYANDISGKLLDASDFEAMTLQDIDLNTAVTPLPVSAATEVQPGGSIIVTTVDEFLAAIGPDRNIILEGELFDLSTASSYGSVGGEYYYWQQSFDGPELVIQNVSGLGIGTSNSDRKATTLSAVPRYANVLSFRNCDRIQLMDFTAGHTQEPGSCSGGVLNFQNCGEVMLYNMGLYGCGILGIQASNCTTLDIRSTEIYECSQGAGQFFQCDGITFDSCDIHSVPSPAFRFTECGDKTWNKEPFSGLSGMFDVDAAGTLVEIAPQREEDFEYHGAVGDVYNPFSSEPTRHYQAGTPQALFAASVREMITKSDWEGLSLRIAFPIQFFTDGYSFVIHDREEFLRMAQDGYFTNDVFSNTYHFQQRIADADPNTFGSCIFGDTCLDHMIAFICLDNEVTEDSLYINAISVVTPLWPGRSDDNDYAAAEPYVPPTPQP